MTEPESPYGIWMMPSYARRRLQQAQIRMNQKVEQSLANCPPNKEIEANYKRSYKREESEEYLSMRPLSLLNHTESSQT